jgi:hypothetical protein
VLAPELPRELRAIVAKAMEREPERRYEDMTELANDLIAFIEGRVVGAWGRHPARGVLKWVGRNRLVSALVLLCGTLLFALLQTQTSASRVDVEEAHSSAWHAAAIALAEAREVELDDTGRAALQALIAAVKDPSHDPSDLALRTRALRDARTRR